MMKKLVRHINLIGHEINQSIEDGYPESDREIYCKRLHTIKEPDEKDCMNCPYFGGLGQGTAHECVWEEPVDISSELYRVIQHKDRYKEMERVSEMIEAGVVEKEKIYPFERLTPDEMAKMAAESLRTPSKPMTDEEKAEDDAEHGYFEDD